MHKLIRTAAHGQLLPTLKINQRRYCRNPKIFTPTSHLHSPTKTHVPDSRLGFVLSEFEELKSSKPRAPSPATTSPEEQPSEISRVHISHPWPEWVDLMEMLLRRGYFKLGDNPLQNDELGPKDSNLIRTACLNFARDRFDSMRFFSREDIRVVASSGCPSMDRKVVNSGKRLRGYVGIDEGHVCSSCMLRENCERAYVKVVEHEVGRTVDIMRILLTHGLDHATNSVENKMCKSKVVKESVRRLLIEMVEMSRREPAGPPITTPSKGSSHITENSTPRVKGQINAPLKEGDWVCPKCNFMNFSRNIRCLRCNGLNEDKIRKLRGDQVHPLLKKGDWICPTCNFFNFANNLRCFLCKENPPKRPLNRGEWECESCNFINFKYNAICLRCDHRRLKAKLHSDTSARHGGGSSQGRRTDFDRSKADYHSLKRQSQNGGGNAWRFVEDEVEDHSLSNSGRGILGFVEFPIAGGKSELSRNTERRERWKAEMVERSSNKATDSEDGYFRSGSGNFQKNQREKDFSESTTDDELDEWFGHGKKMEAENDGGKSELSRNTESKERWKAEMVGRSSNKATDSEDGFLGLAQTTSRKTREKDFFESTTDDEEMDEWFGHGKKMEAENDGFESTTDDEEMDEWFGHEKKMEVENDGSVLQEVP